MTLEELQALEKLAAIDDPGADRSGLLEDLSRIVAHVESLDAVLDVPSVDLGGQAGQRPLGPREPGERPGSPLRADEPRPGLSQRDALGASAQHDETSFLVPRMMS